MTKKLIWFVGLLFFALFPTISAQTTQWPKYSFGQICTLRVPESMEVRDPSSSIGQFIDNGVRSIQVKFGDTPAARRVVFQPSGMNSSNRDEALKANALYSRVIVELQENVDITQSEIASLSASEVSAFGDLFYENYMSGFKSAGMNTDLITWYPAKRTSYGGKYAICIHYKRPGTNGFVDVTEIWFYMGTSALKVTISYRLSEKDRWAADFSKILSTLVFK